MLHGLQKGPLPAPRLPVPHIPQRNSPRVPVAGLWWVRSQRAGAINPGYDTDFDTQRLDIDTVTILAADQAPRLHFA